MPLIYIDESGFQSETTRLYSYNVKGLRADGEYNWQLKNCTNAIGAILHNQLLTVGLYDCSVNTSVFESWVEQDLLPKLKSTSVLIMDNATFHKGKKLIELIKSAGHYIVWLPKYSPDLNPIEKDGLLELNKKLDTYFRNIKIVSEMDLLKINVDKSLFICQNTIHDSILSDLILNKPENFGAKYFICNREFDSLSPSHKSIWKNLSTVENSKFLYESPKQNILSQNSERYSLKLGVDLFWKKEHIKKYKKYLKENYLHNFGILQTGEPYNSDERSFFTWIDDETFGYEQFHLYMVWDSIHYHRRNFEENNRAVIEAKFYNIPFKEITKINSNHNDHYDSLQDRKENPKDYILTKDDKLIKELLQ